MLAQRASSSLTRRIVVLNLAGLVALLVGFLYLNQFREGLIEARVQSLLTQGEIIAGAIAALGDGRDGHHHHRSRPAAADAGGRDGAARRGSAVAARVLASTRSGSRRCCAASSPRPGRGRGSTTARACLLLDSRSLYSRGDILRFDLPPVVDEDASFIERAWTAVRELFRRDESPVARGDRPRQRQGAARGAAGARRQRATVVRLNARGETIVSVAVPIQRFRSVRGALLLSTQGGDIDAIIASERFALLQVFLVAALVMIVLSLFLAGAIAGPVRRLAEAAERVRWGTKSRAGDPGLHRRGRTRSAIFPARCAT